MPRGNPIGCDTGEFNEGQNMSNTVPWCARGFWPPMGAHAIPKPHGSVRSFHRPLLVIYSDLQEPSRSVWRAIGESSAKKCPSHAIRTLQFERLSSQVVIAGDAWWPLGGSVLRAERHRATKPALKSLGFLALFCSAGRDRNLEQHPGRERSGRR